MFEQRREVDRHANGLLATGHWRRSFERSLIARSDPGRVKLMLRGGMVDTSARPFHRKASSVQATSVSVQGFHARLRRPGTAAVRTVRARALRGMRRSCALESLSGNIVLCRRQFPGSCGDRLQARRPPWVLLSESMTCARARARCCVRVAEQETSPNASELSGRRDRTVKAIEQVSGLLL